MRLTLSLSMLLISVIRMGANGASIMWLAANTITNEDDVSTAGTLVAAYNFGTTSVSAVTINSVTFDGFPVSGGTTALTLGVLTVGTEGADPRNELTAYDGLGSSNAPFSTLGSSYRTMLTESIAELNGDRGFSLTLSGLTVGRKYITQFWINQSSTTGGRQFLSDMDRSNAVALEQNFTDAIGGVGQFATGNFVADSVSQIIVLRGSPPFLNGMQLRELPIPEPQTIGALVGFALLLAQRWRRITGTRHR